MRALTSLEAEVLALIVAPTPTTLDVNAVDYDRYLAGVDLLVIRRCVKKSLAVVDGVPMWSAEPTELGEIAWRTARSFRST